MALGKDGLMLEEKIAYSFFDKSYLDAALTHSSYTNEMRTRGITRNSICAVNGKKNVLVGSKANAKTASSAPDVVTRVMIHPV